MPGIETREIVRIDEEKCNGCGECIPSCAEGAIRIVDGKARLVADNLCDGLGACLGKCPVGAIIIEKRPAGAFDLEAVERHKRVGSAVSGAGASTPRARGFQPLSVVASSPSSGPGPAEGGCPGSRLRTLSEGRAGSAERFAAERPGAAPASKLAHWPVQLALVPPVGPIWNDADVLIAADCVPFAMPDFHETLLAGKTLAIACPKLDQVRPYIEKLAMVFARNSVRSVTVAHMEVPCCSGIVRVVEAALEMADRQDLPLRDVTIGVDGKPIPAR